METMQNLGGQKKSIMVFSEVAHTLLSVSDRLSTLDAIVVADRFHFW